MHYNPKSWEVFLLIFSIGVVIFLIATDDPSSLFSLTYFFLIFAFCGHYFCKSSPFMLTLSFSLSALCACYQFYANSYFLPFSDGLLTASGVVGGDDLYFRESTLEFLATWEVPVYYFPVFVGIIAYPLTVLKELTHLDLVLFNVIGHSLIAIFICGSIRSLTDNNKALLVGFYSSIFSGFLVVNGLGFLRDGWTATFFAILIWSILIGRFKLALYSIFFIGIMRPGSAVAASIGIFAAFWFWPTTRSYIENKQAFTKYKKQSLLLSLIFIGIVSSPFIMAYMASKGLLTTGFFRESFVQHYETTAADDNVFAIILQLPSYLRIPISFLHYIFAPYFRLHYFSLIPENLFPGIYSLWFTFFIPSITRSIMASYKTRNYRVFSLFIIYLVITFVISQMSLQLRHKSMIVPLIIILASYGSIIKYKRGTTIGMVIAIFYFFISISRDIYFLLSQ